MKILDLAPVDDAPHLESGAVLRDAGRVIVGTADASLELLSVQPAGKQAMPAADWSRGWGVEPPRFR